MTRWSRVELVVWLAAGVASIVLAHYLWTPPQYERTQS